MKIFFLILATVFVIGAKAEQNPLYFQVPAESAKSSVGTAVAMLSASSGLAITAVETDMNGNEIPQGQIAIAEPKVTSQGWTKIRGTLGAEAGTTGPFAASLGGQFLKGTLQASGEWAPMESFGYAITIDPVSAFRPNWLVRPTVSFKYFKAYGARFDRAPEDGEREFKESKGILYGVKTRPLAGGSMQVFAQGGRGDVRTAIWDLPNGYYHWLDDRSVNGIASTQKKSAVVVVGVSFFLNR